MRVGSDAALLGSGDLDSNFGIGGVGEVSSPDDNSQDGVHDMAADSNGNITLGGENPGTSTADQSRSCVPRRACGPGQSLRQGPPAQRPQGPFVQPQVTAPRGIEIPMFSHEESLDVDQGVATDLFWRAAIARRPS